MDDPRKTLIEALKDVEEANVPEDLREVAFTKAFELRASTLTTGPGDSGGGSQSGQTHDQLRSAGGGDSDPLSKISAKLGIARETVSEVFSVQDGTLELVIGAGKLPGPSKPATKELALAVAAGRQAAELEEWTSLDPVRAVCADFKKLDSPNFARTIREMEDVFNFRRASERKWEVRLARPGWDRASALIRRLGGEE